MERIQTLVLPAAVEIEGAEYRVAERTVAVEEALRAAQKQLEGKPAHRLYLRELKILLGEAAVKQLFAAGRRENVDRLQQIHAGVCAAFERNAVRVERERAARHAQQWSDLTAALAPIAAVLRQLERAEEQIIRRPGDRGEDE